MLFRSCSRYPEAKLLNDDSPIIRMEAGKCQVYGSPWSGKKACFHSVKAELAGIIRIAQAPRNRIELQSIESAISSILPSFPPELYLESTKQYAIFGLISEIISHAHTYRLECLPENSAAELSMGTLFGIS